MKNSIEIKAVYEPIICRKRILKKRERRSGEHTYARPAVQRAELSSVKRKQRISERQFTGGVSNTCVRGREEERGESVIKRGGEKRMKVEVGRGERCEGREEERERGGEIK